METSQIETSLEKKGRTMAYALQQLTEFPLATNKKAANFNTAPKVANLNRAPHHSPLEHYFDSNGHSVHVATLTDNKGRATLITITL